MLTTMPSRLARELDSSRSYRCSHDPCGGVTQPADGDERQPCAGPAQRGSHLGWWPETILPPYAKTNQAQRQGRASLLLSKCRSYRPPICCLADWHGSRGFRRLGATCAPGSRCVVIV